MALTDKDLAKIGEVIQKSESRLTKRIDNLEERISQTEEKLLNEIQKVGVEVVENRTVILQHIHNSPAWQH